MTSWAGHSHRVGAGRAGYGLSDVLRTFLFPGPHRPGPGLHLVHPRHLRHHGGHSPGPAGVVEVDEGPPAEEVLPLHGVEVVLAAEVGLVDNLDTSRHHLIVGDSDAPQS